MKVISFLNYTLDDVQIKNLVEMFGSEIEVVELPTELRKLWKHIPAESVKSQIVEIAHQFFDWVKGVDSRHIIIQGHYGITFQLVKMLKKSGRRCYYTQEKWEMIVKTSEDGEEEEKDYYKHIRFNEY